MSLKKVLILSVNILIIVLFISSCASTSSDKASQLLKKNDELNRAYSAKNWDKVLQYSEEARKNGIGWYPQESKTVLLQRINELYKEVDMEIERVSVEYDGDTARVKNLMTGSTNHENHQDTIYHIWVYHNNDWYLQNYMGWKLPPPSKDKIDVDSILKSIETASFDDSIQEERNKRLLKKNDELNHAYSSRNWGLIYQFTEEARKNGVGWFSQESKSEFVKRFNDFYFWADIKLKRVSVEFYADTATVKNLQIITTILDNKTYIDTVYHDWVYYDHNWYLRSLSYHKTELMPEPNPNDEMQKQLDSIMKFIERKAASFNDSTQGKK